MKATLVQFGSPGRTRTSDKVVNSHPLYQLSYRGTKISILIFVKLRLVSDDKTAVPTLCIPGDEVDLYTACQKMSSGFFKTAKLQYRRLEGRLDVRFLVISLSKESLYNDSK